MSANAIETNNESPFLSVIVPLFNSERFLERCLNSIALQSQISPLAFEIILVDDPKSNDNSYLICEKFALRNPGIRYYRAEKTGVSAARNLGLHVSRGEFVLFADSDDYICGNCLPLLLSIQRETNSDIVVGSWRAEKNGCAQYEVKMTSGPIELTEIYRHLHGSNGLLFATVWNKVFRKTLFRDIHFAEGLMCEDAQILPLLYASSKKTVLCGEITYVYETGNPSSAMTQKNGLYWYSLYEVYLANSVLYHNLEFERFAAVDLWSAFIGLSNYKKWPIAERKSYRNKRLEFLNVLQSVNISFLPRPKRLVLSLFSLSKINLYMFAKSVSAFFSRLGEK